MAGFQKRTTCSASCRLRLSPAVDRSPSAKNFIWEKERGGYSSGLSSSNRCPLRIELRPLPPATPWIPPRGQRRGEPPPTGLRTAPLSGVEEAAGAHGGGGGRRGRRRSAGMEEEAAGEHGGGCGRRGRRRPVGPASTRPPQLASAVGVGGVVVREKLEEGARLHLRRRRPHLPNSSQLHRRPHPESQRRRARLCSSSSTCSGSRELRRGAAWICELAGQPGGELLLRAQGQRGSPPPQGLEAAVGARHRRGRRSPPPPGPAAVGEAARGEGGREVIGDGGGELERRPTVEMGKATVFPENEGVGGGGG
jgi:hypothetical protein